MALPAARAVPSQRGRFTTRSATRGVTLVEILIVVAMLGLLAGSVLFGGGFMSSSRRRAAATLVMAGVRQGIAKANATGRPTRLVFDLDRDRIWLEQSSSSLMLRETGEDPSAGAEPATELEQAAREESERIVEGTNVQRPQFTEVDVLGQDGDEEEGEQGRSLGTDIKFLAVQTQHDESPVEEGRAYLYFWPGGMTEHAVVQIGDSDDDEGITVRVSALTGRAKIERGRGELPEPRANGEISEREEP